MNTLGLGRKVNSFWLGAPYGGTILPKFIGPTVRFVVQVAKLVTRNSEQTSI